MRSPWEWSEHDLLALIRDQVQESLTLDYKATGALSKTDQRKRDEISKDVSAFANSAGGTVVYGMVEEDHLPTRLDSGYDPTDLTREWLEQVINSTIQHRIDGIRINPVELRTTSPGHVAYVLWIPQSFRAPHQAADKRFYRRFNFQSVPMEEYEIRDVSRRADRPQLDLEVTEAKLRISPENQAEAEVQFSIKNRATATASFAAVSVWMGRHVTATFRTTSDWRWIEAQEDSKTARTIIASGSSPLWSPITPGFTLMAQPFTLKFPVYEQDTFTPRIIALARLDHDGGAHLYCVNFAREAREGTRLALRANPQWIEEQITMGLLIPEIFTPGTLPGGGNR